MSKETETEIFIRVLADILEADRVIKQAGLMAQSKARAERLMQLCKSDLKEAMNSLEPLGHVHSKRARKSRASLYQTILDHAMTRT